MLKFKLTIILVLSEISFDQKGITRIELFQNASGISRLKRHILFRHYEELMFIQDLE